MAEEIEEDKLSKVKEIFKPLTDIVNKIGLAKIILFIIVIAIGFWFVNLPKPGTLFVKVSALDANQPIEGALISLQWPDGNLLGDAFTTITDSSGLASFTNVPTEKDIVISIEGTGEFRSNSVETKLSSGASKNEDVFLARSVSVTLEPRTLSGSVSETCIKEAKITVTNTGDSNLDAIFIGAGGLKDAISSEPVTVYPGSSENVTIYIDVSKTRKRKGETVNGQARLKTTDKAVTFNLQVSEPPKIDVTPSTLSCASSRPVCAQIVTVKNTGTSTLSNLQIEPSASVVNVLENGDVERYYTTDTIAPGEEKKFGTRLIGTSAATIGVITVRADCFVRQIDVQTG